MVVQLIAIVLGNRILGRIMVSGNTLDVCYDYAFKYADQVFGPNENYELFELGNPRHQVLFEKELKQLFINSN